MREGVLAMRFGSYEPETILRDALSQCAEIRSRGKEPYIVVLLGEDDHLPQMGRSQMLTSDLLTCAARLQLEGHKMMRELYSQDD